MAGRTLRLHFLLVVTSLVAVYANSPGYFTGGTMSFYYVSKSSANTYKFHITIVTGWELGHGPCGPGCSYADVGKDTRPSRDQIIQSSGNPAIFGDFTKEMQVVNGQATHLDVHTITTEVNQNIAGRVSAVSTSLNWEQEIAHVEVDINTQNAYTDVSLVGHSWKMFNLNHPSSSSGTINLGVYSIQTKIRPKIRSDTLKPNSSPLVLYKPVYMVELDKVNTIRLTASDKDGDVIRCRKGRNVEIQGIGEVDGVDISQDCVITVSAMQNKGYRDNSKGVIGLALDDYNRHPIQVEDERLEPYDQRGLSSSVLDFMIWVVANMPVPEFISPTPQSQQVFTVYAGSKLIIPLAAKPNTNSVPGTHVTGFHVLSLPNHDLIATPAHDDPLRHSVVLSQIEWRTSYSDTGDFIIQAVAIDSAKYESLDRNYKVHVNDLPEDLGSRTDNRPYFPFFPKPGTIRCLQNAVCSIPIYASPGTHGHVISSIDIVPANTHVPGIQTSSVQPVTYRGVHTFRADVHFSTSTLGNLTACFVANDNHGLSREQCVDVSSYPPNPCDTMQCHSSSTCVPRGTTFDCLCPVKKTGLLCDQDVDPCILQPYPCLNGGTCVSIAGRYDVGPVCNCLPGFSGSADCATNTDECMSSPCQNGGICVDMVNQYRCDCINGFTGPTCSASSSSNPCPAKHCQSGSICVVENGNAVCKCPVDKGGITCSSSATQGQPLTQPGPSGPHAIQPTLIPGSEIKCNVGDVCHVPVFLQGNQVTSATAVRGMTSPDLTTSLTPLRTDQLTGLPGTMATTLSVTPNSPGRHTACLEVKDNHGGTTENICYTINTPNTQPGTATSSAPAGQRLMVTYFKPSLPLLDAKPKTYASEVASFAKIVASGSDAQSSAFVQHDTLQPRNRKIFTDQMPPDGSTINCVKSQPCHFYPQTVPNPSTGQCEKVIPTTAGVLAFDPRQQGTTCATDILLQQPTQHVCFVAGTQRERRCYTVHTIDPDPCTTNPCQNGGLCMPDTSSNGFTCACEVPYSGDDCSNVDDCTSDRCEFQGVCEASTGGQPGFSCRCQSGYTSPNCREENSTCATKQCENGAICVIESGHPVCKCPLAKGGSGQTCHDDVTNPLTAQTLDPSKSQTVVPSLGQGTTLHCAVGSTCTLPVYMTGSPSNPPDVITGPTSPSVTAVLTPPTASTVPPGALTSSLSVTPKEPGHHHVCVDIKRTTSGQADDHICYNIETSSSSTTSPGHTTSSGSSTGGGHFAEGTPTAGSEMRCVVGTPCHFIAHTQKPPSGQCSDVRTQSVGVYTFKTTQLDGNTCGTDVLIDPTNLPNLGQGNNACIKVGLTGDERCFKVTSPPNDPCQARPCQNNGRCIPDSSATSGYTCACPIPYSGSTCNNKDSCTSNRCLNQAVCTDIVTPGGFKCTCQPGYEGDDCRHAPDVCSGVQCEHGALCADVAGQGKCTCPLGREGDICHTDNTDIPVDPTANQARPHAVVPTPGNGLVISCKLGESCSVPVYLTGTGGPVQPTVTTGPTSPGIKADVTSPTRSVSPPDTLTSSLTVTPKEQGKHQVCVDIADGSGTADTVCYTVDVTNPSPSQTPAPTIGPAGGKFAAGTLPSGSTITCRDDTLCRVTTMTQKQMPSGQCIDVDTQTVGVLTFPLPPIDSNTCASDVLIEPDKITPTASGKLEACVQVGVGGETRCYTINPVKSAHDPCQNVNCQHGGHCIPDGAGGHECVCPVPYSGTDCSNVDDCTARRCVNQAICSAASVQSAGFTCQCQPGYTAPDCRHAPNACSHLTCQPGAMCLEENGQAVCKCHLGTSGVSCNTVDTDIPVNQNADKTQPHAVVPSAGNGYQIDCAIGDTCPIPVFIHNTGSNPPEVNPGARTPGISGSLTTPTQTSVLPDTLKSTLSVTPTTSGPHHICVDVKNGANVDNVCYTINTQAHTPGNQHYNTGEKFTGTTPSAGARVTCHDNRPCHVIVQTEKPTTPGAKCVEVETRSVGVYSSPAIADGQLCSTDVLLDPDHLTGRACIRVGTNGEKRCFDVDNLDHTIDPCEPSNNPAVCQHGGHCVNKQASPGYDCVCPSFYEGAQCQIDKTDVPVNSGATTTKPHAVLPTPSNGLEIQCETGSTCTVPVYVHGGGHVTPGLHTPDIQLTPHPTTPVGTSQPPNSQVSTVSLHPVTDGSHRACVNIEDSSGVVDNICYTIISTAHHSPSTQPAGPGGGQFTGDTLPAGSSVRCRAGVACTMMVHTKTQPPSQSCVPVQPSGSAGDGVSVSEPVKSASQGSCDTTITMDPANVPASGQVCIEAGSQVNGEQRCYTIIPLTQQDDKCSSHPCQNGGQCVLVASSLGYQCVCAQGFSGPSCETGFVPVNPYVDTSKPHITEPTVGSGSLIRCQVNVPCSIPLYVSGHSGMHVASGSASPAQLQVSCSPLTKPNLPNIPPSISTGQVTFTPTAPGRHHACIDVQDSDSTRTDTVCYYIDASTPPAAATTNGPSAVTQPTFNPRTTPEASSVLNCQQGRLCHFTVSPATCPGNPVISQTAGVTTSPFFGDPCLTDVILDPNILQLPSTACIQVGSNGEKRCYPVAFTPVGPGDLCNSPNTCSNDQVCVNVPVLSVQPKCLDRPDAMIRAPENPTTQCTAARDAFKRAAEEGRMHCTCRHPTTNRTYTVVRPRVPNSRLLRVGGISSAATTGVMAMIGLGIVLVRKLLSKLANRSAAALSSAPQPGAGAGEREGFRDTFCAWPERGGVEMRTQR